MSKDVKPKSWFEKLSHVFSEDKPHLERLADLLKEAKEQNVIDADALHMIDGVLGVSEMRVRDAMIPRGQMMCVDETHDLERTMDFMLRASHSRYPVMAADGSEILGILLAKDVLKAVVNEQLHEKKQLELLYRKAIVVPESKRLNVLLREFKASRNHMAIVVDEYGELAGLITIEDVLEEIVGEIEDEHDRVEMDEIQRHVQGGYSVEAGVLIEDFNTFFNTHITSEQVETMGGVVTQHLGCIPSVGEKFEFENLNFEIMKADERHVEAFRVTYLVAPADNHKTADKNKDETAVTVDALDKDADLDKDSLRV